MAPCGKVRIPEEILKEAVGKRTSRPVVAGDPGVLEMSVPWGYYQEQQQIRSGAGLSLQGVLCVLWRAIWSPEDHESQKSDSELYTVGL